MLVNVIGYVGIVNTIKCIKGCYDHRIKVIDNSLFCDMQLFSESNRGKGVIEVVCGPMFSGKTEELIRRVKRATIANLQVALFKPTTDNRYHDSNIVSHNFNEWQAIAIHEAKEMLHLVGEATVVGIDEAQFFDEDIVQTCQILARMGKRVIIAGLDMDFMGRPFGAMPQLLAVAEFVTKVHAICVKCGEPASYSYRITDGKSIIELGEARNYQPLCRRHFEELRDGNYSL